MEVCKKSGLQDDCAELKSRHVDDILGQLLLISLLRSVDLTMNPVEEIKAI